MFTKAIVKTPCRNMIKGISNADLGTPDYDLALKQHQAYIRALEDCGLSVTVLSADEDFPDSTFIEDACLVTPECAILTNPGAASRKGEPEKIEAAIRNIGLPMEKIEGDGTLDAGDVMMVGDHYYAGLSDRTNPEGAAQLETVLNRYGLTSSTIALDSVLHLKTGVSYLENNNMLAFGEFIDKPELSRYNLLKVDPGEAYAANSVWINDTVIVPNGYEKTRKMIEDAGYRTVTVDVSEFRKLDGGLSCLSLRF